MEENQYSFQQLNPKKASKSIRKLLRQKWLVVVFALILTGLGAALTGVLFKSGIHEMEVYRKELLANFPVWIVLPTLGSAGGLISGIIINKGSPAAGGSGVTHIMAFLRHRKVPMGLRVGIVKLIAGIIAIGSGFPLGPEGPAVQMGGSVAWKMAQWLKAPIAFRRVIVAAGGGAGIAAIFSAPIGGFIYAIEELLNSARPVVLLLVVVTTFSADSWANIIQGNGFQDIPKYPQLESFKFIPIDIGYLIILGVVIGVLAELYCKYVLAMQRKGNHWFKNKSVLRLTISGLVLGIFYSFLPETFHHVGDLKDLLVTGNANSTLALGTFLILFFSTGLAAASGAPGGLFFPMLILGGCIGSALGTFLEILTGHIPSSYIFAGMGAFVAACSRTPITAMFLAFAMTKELIILKPLLITCITSFLIARIFSQHSIYERQIDMELNEKNLFNKTSSTKLEETSLIHHSLIKH